MAKLPVAFFKNRRSGQGLNSALLSFVSPRGGNFPKVFCVMGRLAGFQRPGLRCLLNRRFNTPLLTALRLGLKCKREGQGHEGSGNGDFPTKNRPARPPADCPAADMIPHRKPGQVPRLRLFFQASFWPFFQGWENPVDKPENTGRPRRPLVQSAGGPARHDGAGET